jgi:hypothetical protein
MNSQEAAQAAERNNGEYKEEINYAAAGTDRKDVSKGELKDVYQRHY